MNVENQSSNAGGLRKMKMRKDEYLHIGPESMHAEDKAWVVNEVNKTTGWTDMRKIAYWLNECDGWDLVPQMGARVWYHSFVKSFQ